MSPPMPLTAASISRAQPSAPSVTNATATAASPSASSSSANAGTVAARRPASIFSSLLSSSSIGTSTRSGIKPPSNNPTSPASVAASSVSVSVSTSAAPLPHSSAPSTTTTASSSTSTTTPSRSTNTPTQPTSASTSIPFHPPPPPHLQPPPPTSHPPHPPPHHHPQPQPPPPPPPTSELITQARTAVLASIGNLLDRELTTRAAQLHVNHAAIGRQEREVARATAGLRRENERLGRLAEAHARRVKEIGDVQNWAEMLEREFLILEETVRHDGHHREDGEGDVVMNDAAGPETVPLPASPPAGESAFVDREEVAAES
ncbi:5f3a49b5-d140-44c9-9267-a1fd53174c4d [Thermothielavioides terrestris]|uniref:Biogenesis of lysosome-related organelles complex 1 subunit 1 n=1 Tax=Thermothielavioides terrestris TaxID=2587410 RepID=A0A446BD30_9PEZI|nr:5f3a49b5-d140-44c9-9267-a1fd53174c4d [Thermothielavioides terrestris]